MEKYIGKEAFYLKEKSKIEAVRTLESGMTIAYLENGLVVNIEILRNKDGKYLTEEIEIKKEIEKK